MERFTAALRTMRNGWAPGQSLFLACLVIYLVNGRPHAEVDCVLAPYTAWSLVQHGSFDLRGYAELERYRNMEIRVLRDGRWISYRPPGSAFAAVPFVAPLALFWPEPPSMATMMYLGKFVAAIFVAGAVVLFFLSCRQLAPRAMWPATILLALGTSLWSVASQALWMHGPSTFWLCLAWYLLVGRPGNEGNPGRIGGAGLALGLAVLTRPTTVFFPLATAIALLVQRRWWLLVGLACGGAVPFLLLIALNVNFFGHPLAGGYELAGWDSPMPAWLTAAGLLFAPSRGLLVYTPALVLVPLGTWSLVASSRQRPGLQILGLAWLTAAAATVLCYAHWGCWWGGWCYGPRFFCELMPISCLLFALAYEALQRIWARRLALALVAFSVGIHALGAFGHSAHASWHERHDIDDQGLCMFSVHDTQIEAHARAVLRKISHGRLLSHRSAVPPDQTAPDLERMHHGP